MFGFMMGTTISYAGALGFLALTYQINFDSFWFILPGVIWTAIIFTLGAERLKKQRISDANEQQ